jgi:hypothetical protein
MKTSFSVGLAVVLAVAAVAAELVIVSLDRHGELTWTNSVSNATYRVEWASSVAGPWQKFDALTNLTLLSATSQAVTVKVPMLYRVVWLDALSPFGVWDYRGYDSLGGLLVTGQLTLVRAADWTNGVQGLWELGYAGAARETPPFLDFGPQFGAGWLSGGYGYTVRSNLYLNISLNPYVADCNVFLDGSLLGNLYVGTWMYSTFVGETASGTFNATRQAAAEPGPPNPVGLWGYSGYDDVWGDLVVTGRLKVVTGTNPVAGSWDLGYAGKATQNDPRELVGQQIGSGDLAGVMDSSTRTLRFNLGTNGVEGCVSLEGTLLDKVYIGEWSSAACTPGSTRGAFKAQRLEGF